MFGRKKGLIIKVESGQPGSFAVERAASVLKEEGVIAFPTDTVYGLGCRADSAKAVRAIFKLKGRDFKNPLILFIGSAGEIQRYSKELPAYAEKLLRAFWPGPLTLVVRASDRVVNWKLDKGGTIGLRVPDNALLQEIINSAGLPLATTSANRSGAEESFSAQEVMGSLPGPADLMLDGGQITRSCPSTVLDITGDHPVILRKGAVPSERIQRELGLPVKLSRMQVLFVCTGNTCRSPMAEGYLRHILPGKWRERVAVSSCGTGAMPGMPAMGNSQQASSRNGFDISRHRSSSCTQGLVRQADLIIAMEEKHRRDVKKLVPENEVKLLSPDGVPDPIGGTPEDYLRTMDLIKAEMPDVLELIKEKLD
ncbi:MAG: threonylcarbamoyl-AMP synthase [Candidatus Edwardsbacteria bacterium RIFOXYD12_FULL_50_11]|jgi:L-threonylcarbamoyladenylate synthase|uniref:L-threonylcarbamoyladenylate synthase n=1 Tax=Candidatus Edwardsbacteria bacterium GWF2_54_11 TaxID=1817851 RepID=A0A1F5RI43_9BACT|nr:MAG: threonylcarbamoyl-AMP synthase [Candidatus Edwardsbacteria bacterium RifOxyC12_full_54_24]OGF07043.1 MAG: threonylcarbamoyl-AMP synthase [Candidatus Edwardsbacteria bacterium RifOxyA12_full_54_48]OGF10992.1 MAG: threonylcarbamoyl-AMP synthase [Candidatus Edwardsbacteria bacterium GWE2_54_12]OGF14106.1 MAG: threonylcarbamoyl-AMP synthase [Candidatus Edwardsbacteria bacterium GWF2_54_11]OGF15937.1 MAG: threonylcarbamoyl-AMP synthase [Candidatus Edwardsbacteria bacterium RIFOXYD12_FULL_50_